MARRRRARDVAADVGGDPDEFGGVVASASVAAVAIEVVPRRVDSCAAVSVSAGRDRLAGVNDAAADLESVDRLHQEVLSAWLRGELDDESYAGALAGSVRRRQAIQARIRLEDGPSDDDPLETVTADEWRGTAAIEAQRAMAAAMVAAGVGLEAVLVAMRERAAAAVSSAPPADLESMGSGATR